MEEKDLSKKIGLLNKQILSSSKEIEELEMKVKKKKIEVKIYKNELEGLKLALEKSEIENWRKNKKIKIQAKREKYINETNHIEKNEDINNNEYYSQEKTFYNIENEYKGYVKKNILPYND